MKHRLQGVVMGMLTAIFLFNATAYASTVLQAIYVDFNPIKIFINGQERNPPADMKPFIYEGRTYVSLRYIGEAFGKKVDWEPSSRSVIIADERQQLKRYSESFADPASVGNYWLKTGGDSWQFDGANGLNINQTGRLVLHDVLPDTYCNYTVEFEVAQRSTIYDLMILNLGKNNDGTLGDGFLIGYQLTGVTGGWRIYYHPTAMPSGKYQDQCILRNRSLSITRDEFISVKIQVSSRRASIYVNNEFIVAQDVSMPKSAFAINGGLNSVIPGNYNIRNFNLTID